MVGGTEEELVLHGVELEGTDFSNRRFRFVSVADGSRLLNCDFHRVRFAGGGLGDGHQPSDYIGCVFDGAYLKGILPGRANFIGCSFRDVRIYNFRCNAAQFVDCTFSGVLKSVTFDARPSDLQGTLGRTRNEYRGNDFTHATMQDIAFRGGINLDLQYLPQGPEYVIVRNVAAAIENVWNEVSEWADDKDREDALIALNVLEMELRTGQADLFVPRSLLSSNPEVAERLRILLMSGTSGTT